MHSTPSTIQPLLTSDLTLTCDLSKRSVINNVHSSHLPQDDCNVTMTSKEVEFISSISVMKDTGEELASISVQHQQPRLLADDVINAAVSGNVSGDGDVRG